MLYKYEGVYFVRGEGMGTREVGNDKRSKLAVQETHCP